VASFYVFFNCDHDSHDFSLWFCFDLRLKTEETEKFAVASVCLFLLVSTSFHFTVCRIAYSLAQAQKMAEDGKEGRSGKSRFCFGNGTDLCVRMFW